MSVIFHFNWLNEELVIFIRNWSCQESGLVNKPVYLVVSILIKLGYALSIGFHDIKERGAFRDTCQLAVVCVFVTRFFFF